MNSRRSFIKSVSAISGVISLTGLPALLGGIPAPIYSGIGNRKIYIFSKHLQWLEYEQMAKTAREVGFDGVDLTVRPGGHVLPERVRQDLPKAIREISKNGLLADRITTAITDPEDPFTIDILETASELGIINYRMGWFAYDQALSIQNNLEKYRTRLLKFAILNEKFGLKSAYQNHAGEMVGGPVWDIGLMMDGVNPEYVGIRYDIRHATVEGGSSWPVGMRYLANRINSFDVKDFVWKERNGEWKPSNVQIGDGMVDFKRYFQIIKELDIQGDFTLHLEYPIGGAEKGAKVLTKPPDIVISAMKHDLAMMRNIIL